MRNVLLLCFGFVASLLVASAAVTSLPMPLVYLPLMHITGLLVLNRVGIAEGAVWLISGGIMLTAMKLNSDALLEGIVLAVLGSILTEKVFATRSVYALLGLGVTTGISAAFVQLVINGLGNAFRAESVLPSEALSQASWTLILLLAGLYVGFSVVVTLRKRLQQFFVLR